MSDHFRETLEEVTKTRDSVFGVQMALECDENMGRLSMSNRDKLKIDGDVKDGYLFNYDGSGPDKVFIYREGDSLESYIPDSERQSEKNPVI